MNYYLDLSQATKDSYYSLGEDFQCHAENGDTISFNNYYMERNGKPYFGISGEFHFSRMSRTRWDDEILKMKMCGINTIATYLFWIHHEEEEGKFDFTGQRDIGEFVRLCGKYSMDVILRIGPYSHGECRNGGFPDWLFGAEFEMRKLSPGYEKYVRRYFEQIGEQTKGQYFKDGGPIIAVQIDNEYMHSSSIWDFSRGVNREFIFGGDEREEYMIRLRDIALECGIVPAFFTGTAWGGAVVPDCMMPMWGGYAFRPWMLFENGSHPKTDEYVYQNFHDDGFSTTYDFHPTYKPETRPYCCCEIGGGMMVGYFYRFQYPFKSVDAIANIKVGSGCNFLGYYMYHGGSHPLGRTGIYTNDGNLPKISYDYQAAIGEYGQVRESARRSKNLHYFLNSFADRICGLETELPEEAAQIEPEDMETLRFAVRSDGRRGFLFINNYQDHAKMPDKEGRIRLKLRNEELLFSIGIASDENAVLPFHLDMDGIDLVQATAQPVTVLDSGDVKTYVFFIPEKMDGVFAFEKSAIVRETGSSGFIADQEKEAQVFTVSKGDRCVNVLVVSRKMADQMYLVQKNHIIFSEGIVVEDEAGIRIETEKCETVVYTYPAEMKLETKNCRKIEDNDIPESMNAYLVSGKVKEPEPVLVNTAPHRYTVEIPKGSFDGVRDLLLKVDYIGDIGNAFLHHRLISDNYYNQTTWEIGLSDFAEELEHEKLVLYISPVKEGAKILIDNQMAAVKEQVENCIETITQVRLVPIYDFRIWEK